MIPIAVARPRDTSRSALLRAPISGVLGRIGLGLVFFTILLVIVGPHIAPESPFTIGAGTPVSGPSSEHWMGTDELGRDVYSRFLNGGRDVILLPAIGVAISMLLGGGWGLWSGYRGGLLDAVTTRVVDVVFALPPLMIALLLVARFGTSFMTLVAVIVALFAPRILRVVRGATHTLVGQEFVSAAVARGESAAAIVRLELLPNVTGPMLAETAIRLAYSIVLVATLNYLGLGVQPPSSDWGLMVSENLDIISQNPLSCLGPASGIALMAVGVSLTADQMAAYFARTVSVGKSS